MTLINKIIKIYRVGYNKKNYPFIDIDLLENTIYHLSEFLINKINKKDYTFISSATESQKNACVERLKDANKYLEKAKREKIVIKKMVYFDRAKHSIHQANRFEGDLGKMNKEIRRRQRLGWDIPLLT